MKASKRLLKAIAALVASLVLCVGVCLAWFAVNGKVSANDAAASVKDINIKSFRVKAYNLTPAEGDDPDLFVKGEVLKTLWEYGSLESSATALLLEFEWEFAGDGTSGKNYNVYAKLEKLLGDVVEGDASAGDDYDFKCDLSEAIDFYAVTVSGTSVTRESGLAADENGRLTINAQAVPDRPTGTLYTCYCMISYNDDEIAELYSKALDLGGELNSSMGFDDDINFYMEEAFTDR